MAGGREGPPDLDLSKKGWTTCVELNLQRRQQDIQGQDQASHTSGTQVLHTKSPTQGHKTPFLQEREVVEAHLPTHLDTNLETSRGKRKEIWKALRNYCLRHRIKHE